MEYDVGSDESDDGDGDSDFDPEDFWFTGGVAVGDGFGGEEGEGGDGREHVVDELGLTDGEEADDGEGDDPEIHSELAGEACASFGFVPSGFVGAGEPWGHAEGDDEREEDEVEVPGDAVGSVSAFEAI